jgi:tRNA (guanine37-N1)-methyltransferase
MSFRVTILTLYPEAFPGTLGVSLAGKALASGIWSLDLVQIRTFGDGPHRKVDDTPAGGGAGLVMRADVAAAAIDSVVLAGRPLLYPSPRGAPLTQAMVRDWAQGTGLAIFCGRFEGLDERVIAARGMREVAVGDAVLMGGEAAAQVLLEAVVRLLPGVLGNDASAASESFEDGLLEEPLYTRPRLWEEREIPEVLLSGDHGRIDAWRRAERARLTAERRPDLLRKRDSN